MSPRRKSVALDDITIDAGPDAHSPERLVLLLQFEGETRFQVNAQNVILHAGQAALVFAPDFSIPSDPHHNRVEMSFSRAALTQRLVTSPAEPIITFSLTQTPGSLLSAFIGELKHRHTDSAPSIDTRLSHHMLDLIATIAISSYATPGPRTRRHLRQQKIRDYIRSHLADPDLTPQGIAAAHHITPRALYQIFEGHDGSVAGWILQQRLGLIHADLADPTLAAIKIADIAHRHGFRDAAHFSRRFRARYGLSPRGYRTVALKNSPGT